MPGSFGLRHSNGIKVVSNMNDVWQLYSLQQMRARLLPVSCISPQCLKRASRLYRHIPKIASSFMVLAGTAAFAQCPVQPPAYPPPHATTPDAPEDTLQRDLRSSIAAQKSGKCEDAKLFQKRTLSKEDLQELRRVVREHAKSSPTHSTVHTRD